MFGGFDVYAFVCDNVALRDFAEIARQHLCAHNSGNAPHNSVSAIFPSVPSLVAGVFAAFSRVVRFAVCLPLLLDGRDKVAV